MGTQQFSHKEALHIVATVVKMRASKQKPLSILSCLYVTLAFVGSLTAPNNRNSKHFSLFSVVQFNNEECTSDATPAGGVTQGTCYTSTECTDKNGVSAGKCASGFGVCCVFLNAGAVSATVTENRTRLRNNEYPNNVAAQTAMDISYTINKMQSDICQIRLDFNMFVIAGPANTNEQIGGADPQNTNTHCGTAANTDGLTIVTTGTPMVVDTPTNTLCGMLTGEHLYVELSPTNADNAVLRIQAVAQTAVNTHTAAATDRVWDIKVSQIECFAPWRAPAGCDRYLMSDIGKIISLNFGQLDATNTQGLNLGVELAAQRIKTCIRRSKGMCCVEYQVCTQQGGNVLADVGSNVISALNGVDGAAGNHGYGQNTNANTMQWINPAWSIDINTFPYVMDTAGNVMVNGNNVIYRPNINTGLVDSQCSGDYVEIPSSWSGACGPSHGSARNSINSRYCGARFGANFGSTNGQTSSSTPVCDCSEPFVVRHSSDTVNDLGGTAAIAANAGAANVEARILGATGTRLASANVADDSNAPHRGFCLDYRQMPCWN